jgi:hypothetical protein
MQVIETKLVKAIQEIEDMTLQKSRWDADRNVAVFEFIATSLLEQFAKDTSTPMDQELLQSYMTRIDEAKQAYADRADRMDPDGIVTANDLM